MAVLDYHGAAAQPGQLRVVGDQDQRRAGLLGGAEHQLHDAVAGAAVQITGRLIGQQKRRAGNQGAGQGDTLLLAA